MHSTDSCLRDTQVLKHQLCLLVAALCLSSESLSYSQGSLAPVGAPAPMMKTLGQLEPRTDVCTLAGTAYARYEITNSGSYYLTTNISVSEWDAIRIKASNVTLDLNGFTISGGAGVGSAVWAAGGVKGIKIRNGTVTGFNGRGIDCEGASDSVFEDLQISHSYGSYGLGLIVGKNCEAYRVRASNNSEQGFVAGDNARFFQCSAISNGMFGFSFGDRVAAKDCIAIGNSAAGFRFWSETGKTESCVAAGNGGAGFHGTCVELLNCRAEKNGSFGIAVSTGSVVNSCVSVMNLYEGITAVGALVTGCTTVSNGTEGITVQDGSIARQNTSRMNKRHGIYGVGSVLAANICSLNGTALSPGSGILAYRDCRVEGNTAIANNPDGVSTVGNNNLVIQNSARANTNNFQIGVANMSGPIVNTSGVITNVNPWANFSY